MSLSQQIRKSVLNKRIVKVELNQFSTGNIANPYSYDPVFILDDGTRIAFGVDETEGSDYGVCPIVIEVKNGS